MILGTENTESNIRLRNSEGKFLFVVKMLTYINDERSKCWKKRSKKHELVSKLASCIIGLAGFSAALVCNLTAARRTQHQCVSGTGY